MSAPQGSGKTTICEELQHLLSHEGYQAVFASLDDFYLTFDAQQTLAKVHSASSDITFLNIGIRKRSNMLQGSTPNCLLACFCRLSACVAMGVIVLTVSSIPVWSCCIVPAGLLAYFQSLYSKVCYPSAVNLPPNTINQEYSDMLNLMIVSPMAASLHLHHAS